MATKPTVLPAWAMNDVKDPISQQYNVVEPTSAKKLTGWTLGEKPNRQWWNWFQRQTSLWIEWLNQQESYKVVTDANGVALFTVNNALITLEAVDLDNPSRYIKAIGVKKSGVAPTLTVTDSNVLTLGAGTTGGNQPVAGGANVIIVGRSSIIPA